MRNGRLLALPRQASYRGVGFPFCVRLNSAARATS